MVAQADGDLVRVSAADFDPGAELEALGRGDTGVGARVCFIGTVREWVEARPDASPPAAWIELEHYPEMTAVYLQDLVARAKQRFSLSAVRLVHRVGRLDVGERIVFVAVAAPHRQAAFDGASFLIDVLKTQAPFWKKECAQGESNWVAARDRDALAGARWQPS